jgi:hypothetical protein
MHVEEKKNDLLMQKVFCMQKKVKDRQKYRSLFSPGIRCLKLLMVAGSKIMLFSRFFSCLKNKATIESSTQMGQEFFSSYLDKRTLFTVHRILVMANFAFI